MTKRIQDSRALILAAGPTENIELKTVFSEAPGSIRRLLENPPELRHHGWGLGTGAQAILVGGEFVRAENFREVVDLYRDGFLILSAEVNRNFLAWSAEDDVRIHPLALIELVDNFTRFYRLVLDDARSRPQGVEFRLELKNMHVDGKKTRLPSGPVGTWDWQFGTGSKEAPAENWRKAITVDTKTYDADQVAFLLVRELYFWFGHSEEDIPYTRLTDGTKAIDVEQIFKIR
jgi:hypothetical protein